METTQVHEIMVPVDQYPRVFEDESLKTAIERIEECQIVKNGKTTLPRFLLVFDREETLIGFARRRDILRGLEPEFLVRIPLHQRKSLFNVGFDPNLMEFSYGHLEKGIIDRSSLQIAKVMRPVELTIDHDNHVIKAIYEMVDGNVSILPVLKKGKVIGMLRSVDVFQAVATLVLGKTDIVNADSD